MLKRVFDALCSTLALIVLSPLFLVVMLVLAVTGERHVFYSQARVGRDRKVFRLHKFATMLQASPKMAGGDITIRDDPRVLPVGRVLRRTKVNELPQLLNVIVGEMSLIGYRPLTPKVAALFPTEYWELLRDLRPGLSGIGSIVFRDEERLLSGVADRERIYREVVAPYKAALELWYAKNASMFTDIKLIYLTVRMLVNENTDPSLYFDDLPRRPYAIATLRVK